MADDEVRMPRAALEDLLDSAAERGAKKALASIGLEDGTAARDVRDMRSLLAAYRTMRTGALQQFGKTVALILLGAVFYFVAGKVFPSLPTGGK